jgi:hypothetical protein
MQLYALVLACILLAGGIHLASATPGMEEEEPAYRVFLPQLEMPSRFEESFDIFPAAPWPFQSPAWDVYVHERQLDHLYTLHPMAVAAHGPNCEPPPATHVVTAYEEAVYVCNGHLMTALDSADPGYSLIYLTPNQLADFSRDQAVIRWDISTLPGGDRDWWDVWITPYDENLLAPLEDWLPDLNGPPLRAIHVRFSPQHYSLSAAVITGHTRHPLPVAQPRGYNSLIAPSATQRQTFEIRISRDRLRVGMPALNLWWVDAPLALDWSQGIVQFGHHSYTPHKDNGQPNTWHWDNVSISPVEPFTMIRADRRYANAVEPQLNFARGAPAGSMLRFSGIGYIELSLDDGQTWQPASIQVQARSKDEIFRSYWHPIPPGTNSVLFRGSNPQPGPWHVRSASIWSREQ